MNRPKVIVAILNYNLWEDTIECVASFQGITYPTYEILIADNGSSDGSYEILKQNLPQCEVRSTGANLGYTGGVNACLRFALEKDPSYVLILNNDTVVTNDFLDHLVQALEDSPNAAAACGTIYCHHDPERVWFAGGHMIPWRGLAVHEHEGEIMKREALGEPRETDFLNGCMVLFRASALETVGYEDERFFMVLDDIELSARVRRMGLLLLYVPRAVIYHKVLGEDLSPFKIYYAVRNRFLLIDLAFDGATRIVARTYFTSVIMLKLFVWRLVKPRFFRAAWFGLWDYLRGNFGPGRGVSEFAYRSKG
jgi:GT2 family glycosyltransferase